MPRRTPKTMDGTIQDIYGHITGLKKEICSIKTNHLKHLHEDVKNIDEKLDTKFQSITNWIIYGLGSFAFILIGQLLYIINK